MPFKLALAGMAVAVAVPTVIAGWLFTRPVPRPPPAPEMRLEITTPTTTDPVSLAISPDGRSLVFVGSADGLSRLWIRRLDSIRRVSSSAPSTRRFPFWAPDGRSIGFLADGEIKRIDPRVVSCSQSRRPLCLLARPGRAMESFCIRSFPTARFSERQFRDHRSCRPPSLPQGRRGIAGPRSCLTVATSCSMRWEVRRSGESTWVSSVRWLSGVCSTRTRQPSSRHRVTCCICSTRRSSRIVSTRQRSRSSASRWRSPKGSHPNRARACRQSPRRRRERLSIAPVRRAAGGSSSGSMRARNSRDRDT